MSTSVPAPAMNTLAASTPPLTKEDIEIATRAADAFQRLYYKSYDSATRLTDVPAYYRPQSAVSWNGNPYQGADGMRALLKGLPKTKHEVQSYDCHPIPGSQPPQLLITVSGVVTHGKGPMGNPKNTPNKAIDGQPRVFSQTFMLVPDSAAGTSKPGEVAKYYIMADALRFVG